ncbi:MAG: MFS transporter, partial [Chloroflexota bacterium]|nr:MFS transporter [Chloroflexota bacterium]
PILLLYLDDRFHAGTFLLGVAYAPSALILSVAPGRFGALGDRWSRRLVISLALLSSGLVMLLFPLAPSLLLLSVVWVFEALLTSASIPAQDATVSELTGGDVRGTAYGVYQGVTGVGAAVGPLVGGWVYDHVGQAWPFWINALVLPLAALLTYVLLPERTRLGRSPEEPARAGWPAGTDAPA